MSLPQASFDTVFGSNRHRLQGIAGWPEVATLGRANLQRLLQLARDQANYLLSTSAERAELAELRSATAWLEEQLGAAAVKPLFPRLRFESFEVGDEVQIYLRDTEHAIAPNGWVVARITAKEKSQRPDFNDGTPNAGYYWRWTATAEKPLLPGIHALAFSTSEPRVIPSSELNALVRNLREDPSFVETCAANAWRDWRPLWCIERELACDAAKMDMRAWLREAG